MKGGERDEPTYLPEPPGQREGLALCLSGGGFRAALFHLGALRRLNELGILGRASAVSAVSGGSILAAHLATAVRPWPDPGQSVEAWEERVAAPFRRLASRSFRTVPILRRYALPWNWPRRGVAVESLRRAYERRLSPLALPDLPRSPRFVFNATDLVFGVNWVFERERIGDWRAGYLEPDGSWTVGRAVAASSCFPPVFGPMRLSIGAGDLAGGEVDGEEGRRAGRIRLTDGGLYDNLGLEPVWKHAATVLVSDGGAPFRFEVGRRTLRLLARYFSIGAGQAASLRKRWLISSFRAGILEGAYWGIGSSVERYGLERGRAYPRRLIEEVVCRVRTDLDGFGPAEIAVLENHGYFLADAAIRRHQPDIVRAGADLRPPHEEWLEEPRVRAALRRSHRRLRW